MAEMMPTETVGALILGQTSLFCHPILNSQPAKALQLVKYSHFPEIVFGAGGIGGPGMHTEGSDHCH